MYDKLTFSDMLKLAEKKTLTNLALEQIEKEKLNKASKPFIYNKFLRNETQKKGR